MSSALGIVVRKANFVHGYCVWHLLAYSEMHRPRHLSGPALVDVPLPFACGKFYLDQVPNSSLFLKVKPLDRISILEIGRAFKALNLESLPVLWPANFGVIVVESGKISKSQPRNIICQKPLVSRWTASVKKVTDDRGSGIRSEIMIHIA